LIKIHN